MNIRQNWKANHPDTIKLLFPAGALSETHKRGVLALPIDKSTILTLIKEDEQWWHLTNEDDRRDLDFYEKAIIIQPKLQDLDVEISNQQNHQTQEMAVLYQYDEETNTLESNSREKRLIFLKHYGKQIKDDERRCEAYL